MADGYAEGIGTIISPAVEAPLDRALLEAFVEHVGHAVKGRVADGRRLSSVGVEFSEPSPGP